MFADSTNTVIRRLYQRNPTFWLSLLWLLLCSNMGKSQKCCPWNYPKLRILKRIPYGIEFELSQTDTYRWNSQEATYCHKQDLHHLGCPLIAQELCKQVRCLVCFGGDNKAFGGSRELVTYLQRTTFNLQHIQYWHGALCGKPTHKG